MPITNLLGDGSPLYWLVIMICWLSIKYLYLCSVCRIVSRKQHILSGWFSSLFLTTQQIIRPEPTMTSRMYKRCMIQHDGCTHTPASGYNSRDLRNMFVMSMVLYAKCCYAEIRYVKVRYVEVRYAEVRFIEVRFAEVLRYAES